MNATKKLALAAAVAVAVAVAMPPHIAYAAPTYKCHSKAIPQNAMLGVRGQYEVKEGLKSKRHYGFLERKPLQPQNGCFFAELKSKDCIVMEYDAAAYKGLQLEPQCVLSEGGQEFRTARPTRSGHLRGEDVLVKCPSAAGYECDAGHNSARSAKYEKALKAKGRLMWSYCAPAATNNRDKNIGKKVYCQMYDKKSGTAAFATEFTWGE